MSKRLSRACILAAGIGTAFSANAGAPSDLAQLDFFEKKIRPVLVQECYECHSNDAKKIKGGLTLDTREGLMKGGDSGPSVIAGKPDKSLLLTTMRHEDPDPDLAMPPKKDVLPDQVLADFAEWIKMGAPDPRDGKAIAKAAGWDAAKAKEHWAFKAITNPEVPAPADGKKFIKNPIDSFVLAKLAEKKLEPSPKADKATVLRRVTYDLTGLPPTAAEVDAYLADKAPNAYEKVIDRLLAAPAYGERWARHWLDIARYADTNGDRLNGKKQPLYPYAWTYRDYVIGAMNADLPYDQFIREQIAADRLPEAQQDKTKLAALGFLTVGKRFMNNEQDVIDDRIDVVTKGLMGLTASCARCHDHKFDPIPTKDYYALHGVFNSSQEPDEQPIIVEPDKESADYKAYLVELAKVDKEVDEFHRANAARLASGMIDRAGEYLLATFESTNATDSSKKGDNFRLAARQRGLEAEVAFIWMDRIKSAKETDPILGPWLKFTKIPADQFSERGPVLAREIAEAGDAQPALTAALAERIPTSLKDVAEVYTKVFGDLRKQLDLPAYTGYRGAGRRVQFPMAKIQKPIEGPLDSLRQAIFTSVDSSVLPDEKVMSRALGVQFTNPETAIRAKAVSVDFAHPGAPIRAMTLVDKPNPKDSPVFIRGEVGNRGPIAPRKFLSVLSYDKDTAFRDGSGRLELAQRIANRDNPLTARVIVNRVWQWHFGQAIVRTVSDFGTRSEPPTHPEMLDYLATWFMDNGWSLKKLHKLIAMSATYQQDSRASERGMNEDPTNQWLWRQNVQRLDFEEIRDTLLTLGGKLDTAMTGRPFTLGSMSSDRYKGMVADALKPITSPNRRTVYAMIDRNALPDMFGTFDFANPDMSTGERVLTTVPQQALFMMNSPFVVEQVKNLLAREDFPDDAIDTEKVRFIFRTTLQRQPTEHELELARDFLSNDPPEPIADPALAPAEGDDAKTRARKAIALKASLPSKQLNIWERYAQTVLQTNELLFLR